MAAAERHLLEAEYEDYAATNASGAAFCRSAALIVSPLMHWNSRIILMEHLYVSSNPLILCFSSKMKAFFYME